MKYVLLYTGFAVLALLAWREAALLPTSTMQLHVLSVGQGDSLLLVSPSGQQVVIDGGPDLSLLEQLPKHMSFFDRTIELLIISHPDADHIRGLPELLRRYTVEKVAFTGAAHKSKLYESLLYELQTSNIEVLLPEEDIVFDDGMTLEVLWPQAQLVGHLPDNANNPSFTVKAVHNGCSILLPGDVEVEAEHQLIASGVDLRADILKVPHHGSRTSSSTGFLLAVAPKLALNSSGKDNPFGHPHNDVVDRYAQLGIPLLSTHEEGTISVECAGE